MKTLTIRLVISIAILPGLLTTSLKNKNQGSPGQEFIKKAYTENNVQIKAGDMALKNATDGGVKSFGSQMAADHSNLNTQLHQLAIAKAYNFSKRDTTTFVPETMLVKSGDQEFDAHYVRQTFLAIKRMMVLYQSALNTDDADIKRFAQKSLPLLKDHLSAIRGLSRQLNIKIDSITYH